MAAGGNAVGKGGQGIPTTYSPPVMPQTILALFALMLSSTFALQQSRRTSARHGLTTTAPMRVWASKRARAATTGLWGSR